MNHSLPLQGARSQLIAQLVYFDDEKYNFLDQYFPDFGPKRTAAEKWISDYIGILESILRNLTPDSLNRYVLIGSELTLKYADDGSTETYSVVFPHLTDPDRNRVSFLSPLGYQLLMKKSGDTCLLAVPSGELSVTIEQIKFANRGDIRP
jgi:transcription elongation factor GreA